MKQKPEFDTEISPNVKTPQGQEREMNLHPPQTNTVLIIAGVVLMAALLLGGLVAIAPEVKENLQNPSEKILNEAELARIQKLEQELANLKTAPPQPEQKADWKNLLPAEMTQKFDQVTNQVQNLSTQAETLKQAVTDLQSGSLPERLQKLESHVSQFLTVEQQAAFSNMMSRVSMMGQSLEGQQSLDSALAALVGIVQLEGANATPEEITQKIEQTRAVNKDVATALDGIAPQDVQAATMLLALTQLRQSLQRDNNSFDTDLEILKNTLAKNDPELQAAIDKLAPQAKVGVLTPQGLSKELQAITGEAIEASLTGQDISLQEKALTRLNDIIQIEKNGVPLAANPTQLAILEAQKNLDKGNVEGAIKALQTVDGQAAQKTAPILEQAQATLAATQLQQMLGHNMVQNLQAQIQSLSQTGSLNAQGLQNMLQNLEQNLGLKPNLYKAQ